jgi:methylase of polypeptide subunit release factors
MTTLKSRLEGYGLTEDGIAAALGPVPNRDAAALHVRRPNVDAACASLVRLFVLGEEVAADALPLPVAELEEAGLVERDRLVRARLRLTPSEGLLLAHDGEDNVTAPDYVGGVNNATRTLATLTIREPVNRALDLGTGCGAQALLTSRHAATVVASDVSPRAVEIAGLNARLNGIELELREGSWFEPVGDERFDLIVSNPPFVISPDSSFVFRDAGLEGDAVSRNVVRAAAAHLNDGGYATILCNWICRSGDESWRPLEAWVQESGCDALLLAHEPVEPFSYAALWNEPLRGDREAYAEGVERWLAYYEREEIASIGIGAVVLRRRQGESRRRGFDLQQPATGDAGPHLLRLFAALEAPLLDDDALLASRYHLVEGHRLEQSLGFDEGGYRLTAVRMTLDHGIGLTATIDSAVVPVLLALDPTRPLREVLSEVDVDAAVAILAIRDLLERGFVERS